MRLDELSNLIDDLGINPSREQLDCLYAEFKRDFIDKELIINNLKVKVVLELSDLDGFTEYPETFVHLITRKSLSGKRVFDRHRANKIHWVRCILENRSEKDIYYFEFTESDGSVRDYYWFRAEDFIVIMEKITPDYAIITCFCIDDKKNQNYYESRYRKHWSNKK